jgi:hypothetical protein
MGNKKLPNKNLGRYLVEKFNEKLGINHQDYLLDHHKFLPMENLLF